MNTNHPYRYMPECRKILDEWLIPEPDDEEAALKHQVALLIDDLETKLAGRPCGTVREMVVAALRAGGFDGLYNADGECACELANLFPCDGVGEIGACRAGYKRTCASGEFSFHIVATRAEANEPDPCESEV